MRRGVLTGGIPAGAERPASFYGDVRTAVRDVARAALGEKPPDDLVHDICAEVVLSLGRFRGDCALSSWTYAITVRHVRAWIRSEARRRSAFQRLHAAGPESEHAPAPDQSLAARSLIVQLDLAIGALSPREKLCITLVILDDLSPDEVASRLGISPAAVRQSVSRARARLRRWLAVQDLVAQDLPEPTPPHSLEREGASRSRRIVGSSVAEGRAVTRPGKRLLTG